ncbi:DUF3391 domain-containing protein [Sphingomonas sp. Ant H11]|uniref:DUF3391 domain-containing protein n=1 Tax=Sphingomonas sp. Ant H11 TaxID=1564113 RepID=UPI000689C9B7|nr:DUF3391 domain-containing protein [Sphingomonas sp. Ant H11]
MKIKVPTSAVEIGMFVDSMEGSWWLNPFWKSSFLIASQKDLKRLTSSNIAWVVIDDSRGVGFKKGTAHGCGDPAGAQAGPNAGRPRSAAPYSHTISETS